MKTVIFFSFEKTLTFTVLLLFVLLNQELINKLILNFIL
jgi:hypothetical protein